MPSKYREGVYIGYIHCDRSVVLIMTVMIVVLLMVGYARLFCKKHAYKKHEAEISKTLKNILETVQAELQMLT